MKKNKLVAVINFCSFIETSQLIPDNFYAIFWGGVGLWYNIAGGWFTLGSWFLSEIMLDVKCQLTKSKLKSAEQILDRAEAFGEVKQNKPL